MGEAAPAKKWTPQEYLAWEQDQPTKHEYLDGEIFDLAGASAEHNDICANLLRELGNVLLDKPCRPRGSDQRVHIPETGLYTYPDALVVCGTPEYEDDKRLTLLNPTVIVEVLSESTESYDRGKKFRHYRSIPSLRDYLLVSQDDVWVEHYVRATDGNWVLHDTLPGGTIALASCGVELRVARLYLNVFDAP